MPDPKLKHSGYIDNFCSYQAYCCCDWSGPVRLTLDEASTDLEKHYAEVQA